MAYPDSEELRDVLKTHVKRDHSLLDGDVHDIEKPIGHHDAMALAAMFNQKIPQVDLIRGVAERARLSLADRAALDRWFEEEEPAA